MFFHKKLEHWFAELTGFKICLNQKTPAVADVFLVLGRNTISARPPVRATDGLEATTYRLVTTSARLVLDSWYSRSTSSMRSSGGNATQFSASIALGRRAEGSRHNTMIALAHWAEGRSSSAPFTHSHLAKGSWSVSSRSMPRAMLSEGSLRQSAR